ncbi:MAG: alpha/beta hydrolase [Pseudomonadota bacterium]
MTWALRPRSEFGQLSAIRAGSGPRVILLHGVGLRAEAWACQIDALSMRYEVIAPDMPGHGESVGLPDTPTLRDFTNRVATAMDRPAVVIGHSMGAMIAADLAIRYAKNVQGLVAMNAIYRRTSEAAAAVQARAAGLDGISRGDPTGPLERWFGGLPSAASSACRTWLETVDPQGYRNAYAVFAREDGPPDAGLGGLHCPALFFTGEREPNSTPQMSRAMAALAPKGRAVVLPGAAHMMPMTHPDQVNEALSQFLSDLQSAGDPVPERS